jgi:ubiquitin-protein ligase
MFTFETTTLISAKQHNNNYKKISATKGVVTSQESASFQRIKKEYKDAVQMGIVYDWIHERRVEPKKKKKKKSKKNSSANDDEVDDVTDVVDRDTQKIICLGPVTSNLRRWHFSFRGPGHLYKGIYHGIIQLPKDFPMSPPTVQMWTPSGRFQPFTNICLSASSYHPESWTPKWSIFAIVNTLRLHMLSPAQEIGGIETSPQTKEDCARRSLVWKHQWKEGNTFICVDHARLLEDGILTLDDDDDDGDESKIDNKENGEISLEQEEISSSMNETVADESTVDCDMQHDSGLQKKKATKKSKSAKKKKKEGSSEANQVPTTGGKQQQQQQQQEIYYDGKYDSVHLIILKVTKFVTSPFNLAFMLAVLFWRWYFNR